MAITEYTFNFIFVITDFLLSCILLFLGIVIWNKVKNIAWLFIVFATVFFYAQSVFRVLSRLDIINNEWLFFHNLPIIKFVLTITPILLIIIAFIIVIARKK